MQMIVKDQFVKQISDILEYYDRPQYSEQIEESLTMLTCLFEDDEFWIAEWLFYKWQNQLFAYMEEITAGSGQIRYLEEAGELYDFLLQLKAKKALQYNTYQSYHDQIHGRIKRHFEKRNDLTIGSLRAKDIEQFYESMFADGVSANTVIHYHAVLRRAFQQAFREELIDVNPFDRLERPKKNSFQGDSYSEEELIALLNLSRNDPIYPVIMLAGGLGVRRREVLGVRWLRIDWDSRCVLLDTNIIECKENGQLTLKAVEEMKNRSSKRTLPIPVFEMLLETKARQEFYRKIFKTSYSRAYEDYVCVNQLGELLKPSYVTAHFPILLEQLGLRKIRFHDLRHTFASIQLKNEVPLIRVSNFLGHSDTSTTAKIYAHLDRSSKQPSADIISELYQRGKERWQVGSKD